MRITAASLAIALLASSLVAAEAVKSGLQLGETGLKPFSPLHCNGPDLGKRLCLV